MLTEAHKEHTSAPKRGETCLDYLYCHASRYGNKKDGRKGESPKKSKKRKQDEKREALKWKKPLSAVPDETKTTDVDALKQLWGDLSVTDCLPEDADLDTIFADMMVSYNDEFDLNEKATNQTNKRENRIAKPRQIGDWITMLVNGDNHTIKCNCERCN